MRRLGAGARGVTSPREMLRLILAEAAPVQHALGKLLRDTVEA